jgi:hypothetical protein
MPTELFDLYFIVSQLDGSVIDVKGNKAASGTLLAVCIRILLLRRGQPHFSYESIGCS